jgi:hypothetical protein
MLLVCLKWWLEQRYSLLFVFFVLGKLLVTLLLHNHKCQKFSCSFMTFRIFVCKANVKYCAEKGVVVRYFNVCIHYCHVIIRYMPQ